MFSEEEIKEAFSVLDLNKDGVITEEDLTFFTDLFGGEKVT
jgi:Ca2+-binding EF-hand superfamily protein